MNILASHWCPSKLTHFSGYFDENIVLYIRDKIPVEICINFIKIIPKDPPKRVVYIGEFSQRIFEILFQSPESFRRN